MKTLIVIVGLILLSGCAALTDISWSYEDGNVTATTPIPL